MKIIHETSVGAALAIMNSGKYKPAFSNEYSADSGLNCASTIKTYKKGQLEGYGAVLLLEWQGAIEECSPQKNPPYAKNILLDQHPWRCFIPRDNDPELLLLKDIDFNFDAYKSEFNKKPLFSFFRTKEQINSWVNTQIENEINNIKNKLLATPVKIKIL